jgi:hypothetical protein
MRLPGIRPKSGRVGAMTLLERVYAPSGALGYRSPALAALGVPHWFATRVAVAPGAVELDLGELDPALARLVAAAAGAPEAALVRVRQVHGAGVFDADATESAVLDAHDAGLRAADAIVASRPDRLALVRVADCVPVLLAGPAGARVAAVHAGWRGIVAGVIPAALAALGECAAGAIGPCISAAHFEVGEEVADAFRAAELGECVGERAGRRPHVDLRRAARIQIERARPEARLDETDLCTYAHARELWSHRRDVTHGGRATTGRQGAAIAPRRALASVRQAAEGRA